MRVAIIGAGVAGTALAISCARKGFDTDIYVDPSKDGASRSAVGAMQPVSADAFSRFGKLQSANYPLMRDRIAEIHDRTSIDVNYRPNGRLMPIMHEEDEKWARDYVEVANSTWGALADRKTVAAVVPRHSVEGLFPFKLIAERFVYDEVSNWMDVGKFIDGSLRLSQLIGINIIYQKVLNVEQIKEKVNVKSVKSEFEYDICFIAAGIFSKKIIEDQAFGGIVANRGQSLVLKIDDTGRDLVPALFRHSTYLCPMGGGFWISGSTSKDVNVIDDQPSADETADILERVGSLFGTLTNLEIIRVNVGFRPKSKDRLPIVGTVSDTRIVHVNGLFKVGLSTSLALADMAIEACSDAGFDESLIPSEFRASRQKAFHL